MFNIQPGQGLGYTGSQLLGGGFAPLSGGTVTVDWTGAHRMMDQLLPIPNNKMTVPYDSTMFHGHDGNVYTWTREYGSVKFTPLGLLSASVSVPAEVTNTEGVRPDINYSGTFDGVPTYFCSCNRVKEEIEATYIGSPFGSWFKLPHMPDGYTLVHVRPVTVSPTSVFLIGVAKRTLDPVYQFASLTWKTDSIEPWKIMGMLPFPVGDNDNFMTGLYGVDARVNDMINFPSPPHVLPQMPVGPYDKYSIGMP